PYSCSMVVAEDVLSPIRCAAVVNCFAAFCLAAASWRSCVFFSVSAEVALDVLALLLFRVTIVVLTSGFRCFESVFASKDSGSAFWDFGMTLGGSGSRCFCGAGSGNGLAGA